MKACTTLLALAAAILLAGCSSHGLRGDGKVVSESRPIADFANLEASGAFDIQWTAGDAALTVTADQNLLPHIKTEIVGNLLVLSTDQALAPTRGIKVVVSSSAITNADLGGAIHLAANGIEGPSFHVASTGAASVDAKGSVTTFTANLEGASQLRAGTLRAQVADISLVGASSATVAVAERLKASIAGAGSLTYSGDPAVEQSVTGAGTIRHR